MTGTGAIEATIYAPSAVSTSLVAYNDEDGSESDEVFADSNGFVIIKGLSEGTYTVVAHAYTPMDPTNDLTTDVTITITNVIVVPSQSTNLGRILFE